MTRWRGPQGRILGTFMAILLVLLLLPLLLRPSEELERDGRLPYTVLVLVTWSAILALMRHSARHTWGSVFRVTPMTAGEAGAAIERALDEAHIPHGRPVTRPPATGLVARYEWETSILGGEMSIGILTSGRYRRAVFVGPVDEYNANEMEMLKRTVDKALG